MSACAPATALPVPVPLPVPLPPPHAPVRLGDPVNARIVAVYPG
jgi:hypothetical protein